MSTILMKCRHCSFYLFPSLSRDELCACLMPRHVLSNIHHKILLIRAGVLAEFLDDLAQVIQCIFQLRNVALIECTQNALQFGR